MQVTLKNCSSYNYEEIFTTIKDSVNQLGGIQAFVKPGQKVLIKPNMLTAAGTEKAVCTHPNVVKAVITLVKQAGGEVFVGDSPAIGSAAKVAGKNGIAQVCKELDVPLLNFDRPKEVVFSEGLICKRFVIDEAVLEADVIINLPKLKTHSLTFLTCGVKNLYGCITGKQKAEFHLRMPSREDFSQMLVDLYCLLRPSLTIVDGVIGMEGAGPSNGTPREIGVILASHSAVAIDAVAAQIIGLSPTDIPSTAAALARKTDIESLSDIKILGEDINKFIITDFKQSSAFSRFQSIPKPILAFLQNSLTAKPFITDVCVGCGICKESCPPQVISIKNKRATISYDKCIRCYCCQELCPHNAIELKKGTLGKLLFKRQK